MLKSKKGINMSTFYIHTRVATDMQGFTTKTECYKVEATDVNAAYAYKTWSGYEYVEKMYEETVNGMIEVKSDEMKEKETKHIQWIEKCEKARKEEEEKTERAKRRKAEKEIEKAKAANMTVEEYKKIERAKANYRKCMREIEKMKEMIKQEEEKAKYYENIING